jgi:Uma2 family endonuclease
MSTGMGNITTPEALSLRWAEICRDPALRDLPYKIELNAWGKIEMSPASNRHGRLRSLISAALLEQLSDGLVISEASILTDIGVRVPDVIWGSPKFMAAYGESTPYPRAPEICIEIVSPSNTSIEIREKTRAYLAAGAEEVWIVVEDGGVHYFDAAGEKAASRYPVTLSLPGPIS